MREYIDNYCERLDPGLFAEPLNLVSNLAFIIGAIYVWPKVRHDRGAQILTIILFAIGVGSALFHSFAERWSLLADVIPIQIFILAYLFFATRRILRWPGPVGLIAIILFIPYMAVAMPIITGLEIDLNGSEAYIPTLVLIFLYAFFAAFRWRNVALGMAAAGVVLAISLGFRTIDAQVCEAFPYGTHLMWHLLNGALLSGLILVMSKMPRY